MIEIHLQFELRNRPWYPIPPITINNAQHTHPTHCPYPPIYSTQHKNILRFPTTVCEPPMVEVQCEEGDYCQSPLTQTPIPPCTISIYILILLFLIVITVCEPPMVEVQCEEGVYCHLCPTTSTFN